MLRYSPRALELKKIIDGIPQTIDSVDVTGISLAVWHTLRLEVSGGKLTTLKAYLDGRLRLIGSDVDRPFQSPGKAALGTFAASGQFDDVVLSQP